MKCEHWTLLVHQEHPEPELLHCFWTRVNFAFGFNPKIPKSKIIDLATCDFVRRQRNVCLIGPAGVGKSHIAQALGHRACRSGFSTLFVSGHKMFTELRAARADQSYERKMLRFTNPQLLIIDDLGLRALRQDEPEDLYEVIRRRYERGSIIYHVESRHRRVVPALRRCLDGQRGHGPAT